jgi:hypothetical protein
MTAYFVNVVAKAERDAEEIFDWLVARSPTDAKCRDFEAVSV